MITVQQMTPMQQAVINWLTTNKSLTEVAEAYGVSETSLRTLTKAAPKLVEVDNSMETIVYGSAKIKIMSPEAFSVWSAKVMLGVKS